MANAQDAMSNRNLLSLKDGSEAMRQAWSKTLDDAIAKNDFSALTPQRENFEKYLRGNGMKMRRMIGEGDGRPLLTAMNNYFQILNQFVKDVMIPAESLTAEKTDEIQTVERRINEFGQKEKIFLIEINNAIVNSAEPPSRVDPEMNADDEPEDADTDEDAKPVKKSKKEKAAPRGDRKKLPHEVYDETHE